MYIDEVGNGHMGNLSHPQNRYLSLTGVIIEESKCRTLLHPEFEKIKAAHFPTHPDEETVIFHRYAIVNRAGPFKVLADPAIAASFDASLLQALTASDYLVVTSAIDKLAHHQRYGTWNYNPYHYCLEVLLERLVLEMNSRCSIADAMIEARGKKEDKALKRAYGALHASGTGLGTQNIAPAVMQQRLRSSQIKIAPKARNSAGLQLADLLASPSHELMMSLRGNATPKTLGVSGAISQLLLGTKYRRSSSGKVRGFGQKWLP
jgi:hypothetical protein